MDNRKQTSAETQAPQFDNNQTTAEHLEHVKRAPYQFFKRKFYKGKAAPPGWLFLIVIFKDEKRGRKYEGFILADVRGAVPADFTFTAETLYAQMIDKYKTQLEK